MSILDWIKPVAVFLLGSFLYFSYRRRLLGRAEQDSWTPRKGGKAFDAAKLNKTMKKVRSDHLAARVRPKLTPFHRGLISLARSAVTHLPYFRDRAVTHEQQS
jgi:hypothetical protein